MGHSFAVNRVHIVFSTKERRKQIPEGVQPKLWGFIASIAHSRQIEVKAVGGTDDHVHLLVSVPAAVSLAKCIQELKAISSKWMRDEGHDFTWQEGYAAFSVGGSQVDTIVQYIDHQREHHAKHTFQSEFLTLLDKHGVAYDPKYVLG
jgi:putative transposase